MVMVLFVCIGVAILFHKEKDWMKPDAFDRAPDVHPNRHQLVQVC